MQYIYIYIYTIYNAHKTYIIPSRDSVHIYIYIYCIIENSCLMPMSKHNGTGRWDGGCVVGSSGSRL